MTRLYWFFAVLVTLLVAAAAPMTKPARISTIVAEGKPQSDRSAVIKFSHKFHIVDQGVACDACHSSAVTSKSSSDNLLGKMADCGTCHDVTDQQQCLLCHTDQDRMIPFDNPAREIVFSHDSHATARSISCETCHPGLDKVDLSTKANLPTMATCNTCHDNVKATNTCESCHTNFVSLIPGDHLRVDFRRDHRDQVRLGSMETECQTCHSNSFCQQCHDGAILKAFGKKDLMSDPQPRRSTKDSPNQLNLMNAHDLNYRFTHGIDARARQSECATCHDRQTFCAECHAAGGNITQQRFKPASHNVAGYVTIGVGSGGGIHAQEARRDMETCMGCHDIAGSDPTCLLCHTESGTVR
jgi:hypothetical protein